MNERRRVEYANTLALIHTYIHTYGHAHSQANTRTKTEKGVLRFDLVVKMFCHFVKILYLLLVIKHSVKKMTPYFHMNKKYN